MNDKFNNIRDFIMINPLLTETKIGFSEIRLIVEKIEKILAGFQINTKSKKRTYFVSFELLQNAFRHGKQDEGFNFMINKSFEKLYILSENIIYNDEIQKVKDKLDEINSVKSYEEQKKYYINIICGGRLGVGEAGRGFIEIRLKTDDELLYNFKELDNNKILFSVIATVNADC